MKCLSDELIQRYIDSEINGDDLDSMENHLKSCADCINKIEAQKALSMEVRNALEMLVEQKAGIPEFKYPKHSRRQKNRKLLRLMVPLAAAAAFLLFVIVYNPETEPEDSYETSYLINDFATEIDGNLPLSEQELSLFIIDSDGNITDLFSE